MIPDEVQKSYNADIRQLIIQNGVAYRHKENEPFAIDEHLTKVLQQAEKNNE